MLNGAYRCRYLFDWVLKKNPKNQTSKCFFLSWYFVSLIRMSESCSNKALKFSKVLIKLSSPSNLCETNFILMIGIFPKSLRRAQLWDFSQYFRSKFIDSVLHLAFLLWIVLNKFSKQRLIKYLAFRKFNPNKVTFFTWLSPKKKKEKKKNPF